MKRLGCHVLHEHPIHPGLGVPVLPNRASSGVNKYASVTVGRPAFRACGRGIVFSILR